MSGVAALFEDALKRQRKGELAAAAAGYREVLRHEPRNVDALYHLAQVSCEQGDLAGGITIVRQALAVEPRVARLHNLLGMALGALGRPLDALASIDHAIALQPDLASAHGNRGDLLLALGRAPEAVASYDRALALKPESAESWCNRGAALHALGRLEEALANYQRALACMPDFVPAHVSSGNISLQLGKPEAALAHYDRALALDQDSAAAHGGRGTALSRFGRFDEAVESFDRALAREPGNLSILMSRGGALIRLARYEDALRTFEAVVARNPRHADAHRSCGFVLNELGRHVEALACCDRALAIAPAHVAALHDRANALHALGRLQEALAGYGRVLALDPAHADALVGHGDALVGLGRSAEAARDFEKAVALAPGNLDALNRLGNAYGAMNRHGDAIAAYERILSRDPRHLGAHYNRGITFYALNRWRDAIASFERALAADPDYPEALFGQCMAQLPILYQDEAELRERREAYAAHLQALCAKVGTLPSSDGLAQAVAAFQPFYLAYQGCSDVALQRLYGSMVCRIMADRYPAARLAPPPGPAEAVRVGIVSGHLRQHTVWNVITKGWLVHLDRRRFELFGYSTVGGRDTVTDAAASLCRRFVDGPLSIEQWREAVAADAPHVLIYPEVGMEPVSAQLAAQRLAPVQCLSWGHPETSGFPTLDFFLTSDLMEPPDGEAHYTERLVRLPNLSNWYEPVEKPREAIARRELGLHPDSVVFWCGQSLFKYLPQFDEVFPRIARQAGKCQFLFIQDQRGATVTEWFMRRLDRAFAALELAREDYCVFLPRVEPRRFVATMGACDVFLDSIGWSGGNTTLESLTYNLPVVTMPGALMRGRHSAAILTRIGMTETIARTLDDYVSLAVRLARDTAWRQAVSARIAAGKPQVYGDRGAVGALADFLERVARRSVLHGAAP